MEEDEMCEGIKQDGDSCGAYCLMHVMVEKKIINVCTATLGFHLYEKIQFDAATQKKLGNKKYSDPKNMAAYIDKYTPLKAKIYVSQHGYAQRNASMKTLWEIVALEDNTYEIKEGIEQLTSANNMTVSACICSSAATTGGVPPMHWVIIRKSKSGSGYDIYDPAVEKGHWTRVNKTLAFGVTFDASGWKDLFYTGLSIVIS